MKKLFSRTITPWCWVIYPSLLINWSSLPNTGSIRIFRFWKWFLGRDPLICSCQYQRKPWPNLEWPNLERPNLERLNVERPNLERLNIEKDRTSKDWTSNGTEHRKTERRMGPTSKDWTSKDRTLNGTEPRKTEHRKGPNIERLNIEKTYNSILVVLVS